MRIADSYFVKLANGTCAWLAVGKGVPDGAEIVEVRPVIVPDFGMVLRNKKTGEESGGHWLRGDDTADNWAEEVAPEIENDSPQKND